VSRVEEDSSSFNGALYSLKAFGIATALVVAGGAASVWGVKTYMGVKDVSGICIVYVSPNVNYLSRPSVYSHKSLHLPCD
jgi:hypothetical protein